MPGRCWTSQLERGEAGAVTSGIRRRSSPRRLASQAGSTRSPDRPIVALPSCPGPIVRAWSCRRPGLARVRDQERALRLGGGSCPGQRLFGDLLGGLSDRAAPTLMMMMMMMPSADQFAGEMGAMGVGPGTRVVPYGGREYVRAARVWWMLRAFGLDDPVVLDGGWRACTARDRPVCTEPCAHAPRPARCGAASWPVRRRPGRARRDRGPGYGHRQHARPPPAPRGNQRVQPARAHPGSEERLSAGRPGQDDGPVTPARRTPPDVHSDPRRRACHHLLRRRHRSAGPGLRAAPARPPQRGRLRRGPARMVR